MSKIGEKEILLNGVNVDVVKQTVSVKGSQGDLQIDLPRGIDAVLSEGQVLVKRSTDQKKVRSLHGLFRSLIANAVLGVEKPWTKTLKIFGTGYRVKQQDDGIVLEVGYSHPVAFNKIDGVTLLVKGQDTIVVSGVDKQKVGEVAYKIRSIKKPDPYKGKGIRYAKEILHLKPGKKSKVE